MYKKNIFLQHLFYCFFCLLSAFFLLSCSKDEPIISLVEKESDKYLFVEMAVYVTGKAIPVNGYIYARDISFPQYTYDSAAKILSVMPQLKNRIDEKSNMILGLYTALGRDVGSGDIGIVKTVGALPHLDTILNSRSRKKKIIISKILEDGTIEVIFMNSVIGIPKGALYQINDRTENVEITYPNGAVQKYEFINDLYSIKNWGYINKKDVIIKEVLP